MSAVAAPGGIETRPLFTMLMRVETQAIGPAGGTAGFQWNGDWEVTTYLDAACPSA